MRSFFSKDIDLAYLARLFLSQSEKKKEFCYLARVISLIDLVWRNPKKYAILIKFRQWPEYHIRQSQINKANASQKIIYSSFILSINIWKEAVREMIVGQQAHGSTQHFVDECVGWRSVYQILIWTETSASKLSLMPLAPTGLQVQADLRHSVHQLPLDQLVGPECCMVYTSRVSPSLLMGRNGRAAGLFTKSFTAWSCM